MGGSIDPDACRLFLKAYVKECPLSARETQFPRVFRLLVGAEESNEFR